MYICLNSVFIKQMLTAKYTLRDNCIWFVDFFDCRVQSSICGSNPCGLGDVYESCCDIRDVDGEFCDCMVMVESSDP